MLSKQFRLKKKYQFNYVYRVGKSIGAKLMVLYYCPSKNTNVKVGISVSKKLGHAVVRNRTKRRIREAVYPHLTKLKPNFNVVIIAKNAIVDAPFNAIKDELNYLLKKASLKDNNEKSAKSDN
jgi:ribonuclease P protein component